jgi:copper chaperone CopZ
MNKPNNKIASSTGLIAAIASSLCCIAPFLSILGGLSGGASMFEWVSPLRPYLIGLSIIALGYAFYQAYKPKNIDDCGCDINDKSRFLNSKVFLWSIAIFSILMFTFPYYSGVLYSNKNKEIKEGNTEQAELKIVGMTCQSCENHIDAVELQLNGVYSIKSSYQEGLANIVFDPDSIDIKEISKVIEKETGYTIIK